VCVHANPASRCQGKAGLQAHDSKTQRQKQQSHTSTVTIQPVNAWITYLPLLVAVDANIGELGVPKYALHLCGLGRWQSQLGLALWCFYHTLDQTHHHIYISHDARSKV
jgi:hypothetical protein